MIRLIPYAVSAWAILGSAAVASDLLVLRPDPSHLALDLLIGPLPDETTEAAESVDPPRDPETGASEPSEPSERALVGLSPATPRCDLPYATQGSVACWFEVGAGSNFDGGWMVLGGVGVEWYPVDGFALGVRVDGVGIELNDTPTTGGGGGALLLRWHVYRAETWSVYLDGGCGLVYFAEDVPAGASRLDFSPQVGGGVTYSIAEDLRLMVGLRWYHLSNAQTNSTNPGVDMLEAYVGVTFSF